MQNILSISYFNEITNAIKAMKADYVCIYGDLLLGTDNTMTMLKTYELSTPIPLTPITIITKELSSEFYNNITDTEIVFDFDECKIYCPNNKSYADSRTNPMINKDITSKIIDIHSKLVYSAYYPMHKMIDFGDITNDEHFQRYKELKAADGAELYVPYGNNEYSMYLYSGALPLNKMDKVQLSCCDEGNTFMALFTVFKKKLNPIGVCFRFVKV